MESALHIPADIFEEMAGMKEIVPPKNESKEENVKSERIVTPINDKRLKEASIALFSKVQKKLCNSFYKIAKKLLSFQQKDSPVKPRPRKIEIFISYVESAAKTGAKALGKNFFSWRGSFRLAWTGIKLLFNIVFNLLKWLGKLAFSVTTNLLKIFGSMIGFIQRAIRPVARLLKRTITKMSRWIYKMMKPVLKAIWNIVKKLFFRGKPASKMFKGEPVDKAMKQPVLSKKKNKMKLKLKAIGKKSSFIMKVVKKLFKALGKIVWKIIKTIFGKLITKIVKTFVKMIIKFIASQVIGSLIPFLGNAIMGALSIALLVLDVVSLVGFISEVSRDTKSLQDEVKPEPDEGDEPDEDDVDIDSMNMEEVKQFMETLASNGKENSSDYLEAKARYLELLSESYEKAGDAEIAEMIQLAGETGVVSLDLNLEPPANIDSDEALKKLDLNELQRTIEKRKKELSALKWKNKAINVFDEKEIKILLTGEEDGGPMWVAIWQDIIWYVKTSLPNRHPGLELFKKICQEVTAPYPKEIVLSYYLPPKWTYESEEVRNKRVAGGAEKILNKENNDYHYSSAEEFGKQMPFNEVIDKVHKYKFSLKDDAQKVTDAKVGENMLQKYKYFRWEEILEILSKKEDKVWSVDELLNAEDISFAAKSILVAAKLGLPV